MNLLLVDDEPLLLRAVYRILSRHATVTVARNGAEAVEELRKHAFDLILSDVMMPGGSGMYLHQWVKANQPELLEHFVFMTGGMGEKVGEYVRGSGARVLGKPVTMDTLLTLIPESQ